MVNTFGGGLLLAPNRIPALTLSGQETVEFLEDEM